MGKKKNKKKRNLEILETIVDIVKDAKVQRMLFGTNKSGKIRSMSDCIADSKKKHKKKKNKKKNKKFKIGDMRF